MTLRVAGTEVEAGVGAEAAAEDTDLPSCEMA